MSNSSLEVDLGIMRLHIRKIGYPTSIFNVPQNLSDLPLTQQILRSRIARMIISLQDLKIRMRQ